MRMHLIVMLSVFTVAATALASTTPEENRKELDQLLASRTGTVWTCTKGVVTAKPLFYLP